MYHSRGFATRRIKGSRGLFSPSGQWRVDSNDAQVKEKWADRKMGPWDKRRQMGMNKGRNGEGKCGLGALRGRDTQSWSSYATAESNFLSLSFLRLDIVGFMDYKEEWDGGSLLVTTRQ